VNSPVKAASDRVKIRFELDPDNEQGYEVENLWAEPLGRDHFRILNAPFFVFGVSSEDVVRATRSGQMFRFREVARRGRHSTYRIFLQNDYTIHDDEFQQHWRPISTLGSTFENANDRFVAVDIPPEVNVSEVYRLLKKGEEEGIWAFEEGHYAGA
jgi:hypothetical protein